MIDKVLFQLHLTEDQRAQVAQHGIYRDDRTRFKGNARNGYKLLFGNFIRS